MNDHDLVMKHENQLNAPDGLMNRVDDVEKWKNNYLVKDRKETCFGAEKVEDLRNEILKMLGDKMEMTKVKLNSGTLILVALIGAIPGVLTFLIIITQKHI